jgi:Holliday junction resolvasome RuvABC DNA-binding subunit
MNNISAFQSGVIGIQNGIYRATENANTIARADEVSTAQLTQALVQLGANKQQVQAASKVVEASLDTVGTLLDVKA